MCCLAWKIPVVLAVPAHFGGEGLYALVAVNGVEAAAALLPVSYVPEGCIAAALAGGRKACL